MPYDMGSIMHYAANDGSRNQNPTMEAKNSLYQNTMGQRITISFNDAKIVNRAYCSGKCNFKPSTVQEIVEMFVTIEFHTVQVCSEQLPSVRFLLLPKCQFLELRVPCYMQQQGVKLASGSCGHGMLHYMVF